MIKETIYNLRRQPVVAAITIVGTALSIFLIMVFVMMNQVKVSPFAPESNRDRFMHYNWVSFRMINWDEGDSSNGPMSWRIVNELFYTFKAAEAVTAYTPYPDIKSVGLTGERPCPTEVRETDVAYFDVFDFSFISGKPFSREDFEAGIPVAVIDSNVARNLFGTERAEGKTFLINGGEYRVSGVVKPVSPLAKRAYAQVWINTMSTDSPMTSWSEIGGRYTVTMLRPDGKSPDDFRADFAGHLESYKKNLEIMYCEIINHNRPYTQEQVVAGDYANIEPDVSSYRRIGYTIYAILLLVPAINLASMTHSRMRKRVSEMAVRRAFGATRLSVFMDIIAENMFVTLLGGAIGLLLSVIAAFGFSGLFFTPTYGNSLSPITVNPAMLLQWSTFGLALLFCFVLNMLSAGLPAIQMSRLNIVNSLRGGANK